MKKSALSLKSNMIINLACKPVSMVLSYMYVPMMLHYLGTEKYGIWATILTILSWIGQFDIGIGNGLRNKLTESLSLKDGRAKTLVSSAYAFIAVIMAFLAIAFSAIASVLDWERIFGVSDCDENLPLIIIISILFVTINFVISICKNVLYALQKAADVSIIEVVTQILSICGLLLITKKYHASLFAMAVVYGSSMLIANIGASIILYLKNAVVRPGVKSINIKCGRDLTKIGLQFFVIQICALILYTTDSLIISYLYGAKDVTPYSTVNKLFNVIIVVFTAILTPVWSAVSKQKAEQNWVKVLSTLKKLYLIMIPFVLGAVFLGIIFKPLSDWWLREELYYENGLILFGALYCILMMWCNTHATFTNGLGLLKIPLIIAVIQAMINIPLSLFFAQTVGMNVTGILVGTVMTMIIPAIALPILTIQHVKQEIANHRDTVHT